MPLLWRPLLLHNCQMLSLSLELQNSTLLNPSIALVHAYLALYMFRQIMQLQWVFWGCWVNFFASSLSDRSVISCCKALPAVPNPYTHSSRKEQQHAIQAGRYACLLLQPALRKGEVKCAHSNRHAPEWAPPLVVEGSSEPSLLTSTIPFPLSAFCALLRLALPKALALAVPAPTAGIRAHSSTW